MQNSVCTDYINKLNSVLCTSYTHDSEDDRKKFIIETLDGIYREKLIVRNIVLNGITNYLTHSVHMGFLMHGGKTEVTQTFDAKKRIRIKWKEVKQLTPEGAAVSLGLEYVFTTHPSRCAERLQEIMKKRQTMSLSAQKVIDQWCLFITLCEISVLDSYFLEQSTGLGSDASTCMVHTPLAKALVDAQKRMRDGVTPFVDKYRERLAPIADWMEQEKKQGHSWTTQSIKPLIRSIGPVTQTIITRQGQMVASAQFQEVQRANTLRVILSLATKYSEPNYLSTIHELYREGVERILPLLNCDLSEQKRMGSPDTFEALSIPHGSLERIDSFAKWLLHNFCRDVFVQGESFLYGQIRQLVFKASGEKFYDYDKYLQFKYVHLSEEELNKAIEQTNDEVEKRAKQEAFSQRSIDELVSEIEGMSVSKKAKKKGGSLKNGEKKSSDNAKKERREQKNLQSVSKKGRKEQQQIVRLQEEVHWEDQENRHNRPFESMSAFFQRLVIHPRVSQWYTLSGRQQALQEERFAYLPATVQKKIALYKSYPQSISYFNRYRGVEIGNQSFCSIGTIATPTEIHEGFFTDAFNGSMMYHHCFTQKEYNDVLQEYQNKSLLENIETPDESAAVGSKTEDGFEACTIEETPFWARVHDKAMNIFYTIYFAHPAMES